MQSLGQRILVLSSPSVQFAAWLTHANLHRALLDFSLLFFLLFFLLSLGQVTSENLGVSSAPVYSCLAVCNSSLF